MGGANIFTVSSEKEHCIQWRDK